MFGMSFTEIAIILVLALLLLGPDQLPGMAKAAGKAMRELRKASDDLKSTLETEMVRLEAEADKPVAPPGLMLTPPVESSPAAEPVTLDQARHAAPIPRDPASLRALARTNAVTRRDPAAARAAARAEAAAPPAVAKSDEPAAQLTADSGYSGEKA